jgi:VIT1/CCC1 family predicted Fe2+/Mn2+ transporter
LESVERISEVLFGLVMVLAFTGSLSVADAGRDDVRAMLIGAVGCNLAWAVIVAFFYLMGSLAGRGARLSSLRAVQEATDPGAAHGSIRDAAGESLAGVLTAEDLEVLRLRMNQIPLPARPRLRGEDFRGAVAVFLWVFLSTFPVTLPFLFMDHLWQAMRVSNGIAVLLLFLAGFACGRCVGRSPWLIGLAMVLFGGVLVSLTIALGG